jgi:lipopolysaccharide biosynthesis protein
VIGHLHGKRGVFLDDGVLGESWREFLWQNLLGDRHPMMDMILDRFESDCNLGIVFPDDPHLSDWDFNRDIATGLAERKGIRLPLAAVLRLPRRNDVLRDPMRCVLCSN